MRSSVALLSCKDRKHILVNTAVGPIIVMCPTELICVTLKPLIHPMLYDTSGHNINPRRNAIHRAGNIVTPLASADFFMLLLAN